VIVTVTSTTPIYNSCVGGIRVLQKCLVQGVPAGGVLAHEKETLASLPALAGKHRGLPSELCRA
jgi:hypothetical protein